MSLKAIKSCYAALRNAFETQEEFRSLLETMADRAMVHMCHPFGDIVGGEEFYRQVYQPLFDSLPDLERRDMMVIAGETPEGQHWLGAMGNYMGLMTAPFLDIPPTGRLVHMRYHEFYRFEGEKVIEIQAIWDIPELMMQASAWPMAPQLGDFLCTPAPMDTEGSNCIGNGPAAMTHVKNMLADLCRHPADPDPGVMQLEKYWHPKFNWYGPAGIGTARGIAGFRHWHQIPFLRAMPDRKLDGEGDLMSHWFAEGDYVCETGWPNMRLTLSGDGWMGIPPVGKEVLLRSLDFWRLENGKIRENWVLVDLLDLYAQIGVDVFARLGEFNKARNMGVIAWSHGVDGAE